MDGFLDSLLSLGLDIGTKILGAFLLWVVGKFVIKTAGRLVDSAMQRRGVDKTLTTYLSSALGIALNVILFVLILGVFGVETTTLAGLVAAAGVAIGLAWSGLLSNFASGVFMVVLRPFKAGDFIQAGGVTGTVQDIGLFVTSIITPDNVLTFVGNSKIFGDNISNYSSNPHRRVDLKAQLAHGADHKKAIAVLKEKLGTIEHVLSDPAPQVEILDFTLAGPVLAVRSFCHTDHYWDVYFATTTAIREDLGALGLPVPEQHYSITQSS